MAMQTFDDLNRQGYPQHVWPEGFDHEAMALRREVFFAKREAAVESGIDYGFYRIDDEE